MSNQAIAPYGEEKYIGKILLTPKSHRRVKVTGYDYSNQETIARSIDRNNVVFGSTLRFHRYWLFYLEDRECIKAKLKANRAENKKKEKVFSTHDSRECLARELVRGDKFKKYYPNTQITYSTVYVVCNVYIDHNRVHYKREDYENVRMRGMDGDTRVLLVNGVGH